MIVNRNNPKFLEKFPNVLSFKLFGWVFCLFRFNRKSLFRFRSETTETNCFETNRKNRKKRKNRKNPRKKQKKNRKNSAFSVKNNKICCLSNCFGWSPVCFGSIETSKLSVSVQKRNNRNKRFVSDSAETSFGSSFGCFESKIVSKDTLALGQRLAPYW